MLEFIRNPRKMLPAVLAVVLAAPVAVWAEAPSTQPDQSNTPNHRHHEGRKDRKRQHNPGIMLDRMHETINSLDLSADQKTQVDAIFTQAKSDFEAMREKWEKDDVKPGDRMKEGREFMKALNKKVEAVLTDQQKEALKKKRQEWAENRKGRGERGDRQGPSPMAIERLQKALDQLNLTDDQKQQVKTVLDETRTKLKALHEESGGDREAMHEKGRKIIEEARDRINSILTPEQREKLKEMREKRRSHHGDKGKDAPAEDSSKT
ncbi:MAG: hypothetical protein IT447_14785 [Phycisphaerales bacterium]|jgi:Spy/CpxP family protein refolding chaperone|nr:hypothetical protein [Phycisphaerales bacterium]